MALDARLTSHMSVGMTQYAVELIERLPRIAPDLRFDTFGSGDNFDMAEQAAIPIALARNRPRLAHFLAPFAPLVIPVPYVVTIHDLIDVRFAQFAKPSARWYYRTIVRRLARRAARVITDDEGTAEDLVRLYGVRRERIAVIPLGVDLDPAPAVRRARPYVIYAGNRRPHKDLTTLWEAWRRVDPSLAIDLVMTGDPDDAPARRDGGEAVFLGDASHRDLMAWIAGAKALVHPALAEGFGLPLLEAMRVGTPVVVCDAAVPSVLRPHARTFPASDADACARAIEAVVRGDDAARAALAMTATAGLTWDRCAGRTAALYRELLAS